MPPTTEEQNEHACVTAAKIEFLTIVEIALNSGKVVNMAELPEAFKSMCKENNVSSQPSSRRSVMITREISGVEFQQHSGVNGSERISIKVSRDSAISLSESISNDNVTGKYKWVSMNINRFLKVAGELVGITH